MPKKLSRYSKFDPAHVLDGLFVPRTDKGQALYDVRGEHGGGTVSFKGVQLGVQHQSVLFAIAARMAQSTGNGSVIIAKPEASASIPIFAGIKATKLARGEDFALIRTSSYCLLLDAGMGTGRSDYERLKELLHDLTTVTIMREFEGKFGTSNLLEFWGDDETKELNILLNWRLTASIFGKQNIQISLCERHGLGAVAKILHTWLSSFVNRGEQLGFGNGCSIEKLITHVWGKKPFSDSVLAVRQKRIRAALREIGQLPGWTTRIERNIAFVSRPKDLPHFADECEAA